MKRQRTDNFRPVSTAVTALLVVVICLVGELLIANFHGLVSLLFHGDTQVFFASTVISDTSTVLGQNNSFVADSTHTTLTFSRFTSPVRSVRFRVQVQNPTSQTQIPSVHLSGSDENLSGAYIVYAQAPLQVGTDGAQENVLRFSTHGTPEYLRLQFSPGSEVLAISDIVFNAPEEFSFSLLRFLIFVLVGGLMLVSKTFSLSQRPFDVFSPRAKNTLVLLTVLAIGISLVISLWFCGEDNLGVYSYPLTSPVENYSPYVQQFDAFMKGQLHLDVSVSEELLALENPYDPMQRTDVYSLWDRAFYQGHYYSYFGIAPLLVLYFPCYFLFGVLPSEGLVMLIFSLASCCFALLCLWELVKCLKKKLSYTHFILGSLACLFGSMIWLMQRGFNRFYYLACLSAMAFFFLFFYLLIKGLYSQANTKKRRVLLLGAGLAYGLLFLSRINAALIATAVVAAMLVFRTIKNKHRLLSHALDLCCLAFFVAVALGFSLWFNAARFGNPLEFGTTYQLTVSNVSYNRLGTENLIPSLYHYFFAPLKLSTEFPFFYFSQPIPAQYGHYMYLAETNAGLFSMPLMWTLFAFPLVWKKRSLSKEYRTLCLVALLALPITGFLNYSLGGSILRYVSDLAPAAALLSTLILWELCDSASAPAKSHGEKTVLSLSQGLCILSVGMGILLLFTVNSPDFAPLYSQVFMQMRSVFVC